MSAERPGLRELEVLECVAREGNFSAAARALGLARADVSRIIARLEQRLALRLCTRTTRQVALTEAGRELVARVSPALREIHAALDSASDHGQALSGVIRLSCSHAFGRHYLLAPLAEFAAMHPGVDIQLSLNYRFDNLLARSLDIAIRLGSLSDSSMVARRIGRVAAAMYATPALVGSQSRFTVEQLLALPAIAFRVPESGERRPWRMLRAGQEIPLIPGRVAVDVDSIEAVCDLVRAGAGVALAPRYLVGDDLAAGRLIELDIAGGRFAGPEAHLCFMSRSHQPRRVRELCDHLIARLPETL